MATRGRRRAHRLLAASRQARQLFQLPGYRHAVAALTFTLSAGRIFLLSHDMPAVLAAMSAPALALRLASRARTGIVLLQVAWEPAYRTCLMRPGW